MIVRATPTFAAIHEGAASLLVTPSSQLQGSGPSGAS